MNEVIEKEILNIENMIYEIDGKEVMLDRDLANLYECKNGTKEINQAVKNNPNKFPNRFSWILSDYQYSNLRSKISTTKISNMSRVNPRVFTEQGVYMLATILKSDVATEVSIRIMDTFVRMRHYINYNMTILPNRFLLLEDKVDSNTRRIDELLKEKYDSQYGNITFINSSEFHDRFIILDRKRLYLCGASLKDVGKKCFGISEINYKDALDIILNKIFD